MGCLRLWGACPGPVVVVRVANDGAQTHVDALGYHFPVRFAFLVAAG